MSTPLEFDPQPYEKCEGSTDRQRCRYDDTEMVVLAREGNSVTVRPLGSPYAPEQVVDVHSLRPSYITLGR